MSPELRSFLLLFETSENMTLGFANTFGSFQRQTGYFPNWVLLHPGRHSHKYDSRPKQPQPGQRNRQRKLKPLGDCDTTGRYQCPAKHRQRLHSRLSLVGGKFILLGRKPYDPRHDDGPPAASVLRQDLEQRRPMGCSDCLMAIWSSCVSQSGQRRSLSSFRLAAESLHSRWVDCMGDALLLLYSILRRSQGAGRLKGLFPLEGPSSAVRGLGGVHWSHCYYIHFWIFGVSEGQLVGV